MAETKIIAAFQYSSSSRCFFTVGAAWRRSAATSSAVVFPAARETSTSRPGA
jgi:hypothetical protein